MSYRLEFWIAMRYLRSKRKEGFISVVSLFSFLGIMLGVATLIVVMSVMNGFHVELLKNILGMRGHITVQQDNFTNYTDLVTAIQHLPQVKSVEPILLGEGLAVGGNKRSQGVLIRGMRSADIPLKPTLYNALDADELAAFANNEGILLGNALAIRLGVAPGDEVKLLLPDASSTIIGMIPRSKTYKVIGTFDLGMYQYNSTLVIAPLELTEKLLNKIGQISELEISCIDPEDIISTKYSIKKMVGEKFIVSDWQGQHNPFLNSLAVERAVMFCILTMIIMVAAFNIISSLIMLVKDKTRNIAILKTMGMESNAVMRIFIMAGSMVGLLGSIFGVALGVTGALYVNDIKEILEHFSGSPLFDPIIYYLSKLPSELDPYNVLCIAALAIVLSVLATIYPARKAAKLLPAQVLRNEV